MGETALAERSVCARGSKASRSPERLRSRRRFQVKLLMPLKKPTAPLIKSLTGFQGDRNDLGARVMLARRGLQMPARPLALIVQQVALA